MPFSQVVLTDFGGPDRLDAVQPFLFNLFNDPAIIGLPQPVRWMLAQVISRRRAPVGGGSIELLSGDLRTAPSAAWA
mgnify:CR=1 FL=1